MIMTRCKMLLLVATLVNPLLVMAKDDLPRRASWQAGFRKLPEVGMQVIRVQADSPLAKAGIVEGDRLLAVNHAPIRTQADWDDLTDSLVADDSYHLTMRREHQLTYAEVSFPPLARENWSGLSTQYSHIINDFGIRQRIIVTKPEQHEGPLPAIFLLPGLSCSSIEYTPGRKSNFIRTITQIARESGMVMMRVEKPGMGDSEGKCSQTDLNTELNGYEVALQQLIRMPDVDATRIVIYGSSMGAALAPYLTEKYQLNGMISDGPFFRSWFEHMLEIERRIKIMQGMDHTTLNQQMIQAYIPLYYGMLVEQRSYADVIRQNPLLAQFNYHGNEHMYGRPMAYFHQVQAFNFAGAWEKVSVPVRVRWGTNDWIMSEADIDMIGDVLAKAGNQNVQIDKFPDLDHWYSIHTSADASFNGEAGEWNDKISQQIVDWIRQINRRSWRE